MANRKICQECKHFGACTTSKNGMMKKKLVNKKLKEKFEQLYKGNNGQEVYPSRSGFRNFRIGVCQEF